MFYGVGLDLCLIFGSMLTTTTQGAHHMIAATEPQINFLKKLVRSHDCTKMMASNAITYEDLLEIETNDYHDLSMRFSKQAASSLIDQLKLQPFMPKSEQLTLPTEESSKPKGQVTVTEAGIYRNDSGVYVVKPNREGTRFYAKRLVEAPGRLNAKGEAVPFEFQYEAGAIFTLTPEHKMPFAEAEELTIRYGACICCGRHLKAAKSVKQGIGPKCARRFFNKEV